MPKRLQPRAKSLLHEMAEAPTEADARAARERFRTKFDVKYPKAIAKLDRFPAITRPCPRAGSSSEPLAPMGERSGARVR